MQVSTIRSQRVLELTHVPGPAVPDQRSFDLGRQNGRRLSLAFAGDRKEVTRQRQDVVGTLSQRRNDNRHDAELQLQVLVEASVRHEPIEIADGWSQ